MPKDASNFVTTNDRFGAIAVISGSKVNDGNVPTADSDYAGAGGNLRPVRNTGGSLGLSL